jgi:mono/diheme cytochrome c family protein
MSIPILVGAVAALFALRFAKLGMLVWLFAWWAAIYAVVRFGVNPPLPSSIVTMFMAISTVALLTYIFADSQRLETTKRPMIRFLVDAKYRIPLLIVVLAIPLLVAAKVYLGMSKEIAPPAFARTIHPAPPTSISFKDKQIDLAGGTNPYRALEKEDPARFAEHARNGRRVYYQNCVFCHGDNLDGAGIFAHALEPIPANFQDPTTIGNLQETYLFWRIAKGAPGLPEESGPWASAMPAWEQILSEDEIWDVIIFLYDHTASKPRAPGAEH